MSPLHSACSSSSNACQQLKPMQYLARNHESSQRPLHASTYSTVVHGFCCVAAHTLHMLTPPRAMSPCPLLPAWVLQAQAGQDGGGDRRDHARRPRRPRPELVLHINTAEGLQQVTSLRSERRTRMQAPAARQALASL